VTDERPEGSRVLALIGSGETSPTMVTVHRELSAGLDRLDRRPEAVLLETPYRFQENASDVSARACSYFARSVGLDVAVLPGTRAVPVDDLALLRRADWVFSGPGSPTYALEHWRSGPIGDALRERLTRAGGVTVLASAAAATVGRFAVPVYEIYKVGSAPHWVGGLDLLAGLGLDVAVVPHYDNTEGGTHDTRYCYLGERRLAVLEAALPPGAAVLGVDEHTAVVIELPSGRVAVRGRGALTVRRTGRSTRVPAGGTLTIAELRGLIAGAASASVGGSALAGPSAPPVPPVPSAEPPVALPDLVRDLDAAFERALDSRDAAGAVAAVLDLEAAIRDWAADTDEDQGTEQARAVLRAMITRLGRHAESGLRDPRDALGPAVEPLLALRTALRGEHRYADADLIRRALAAAGMRVEDTADGTHWSPDDNRRLDHG
jgi:hypothetical protein